MGKSMSAAPKFTPGPWTLSVYVHRGEEVHSIGTTDGVSLMGDQTEDWTPRNPADWSLIAAAPELYEALVELIATTAKHIGYDGELYRARAKACTALAKVSYA